MSNAMALETLRQIWEVLMDLGEYELAQEVNDEILSRTIARDAILDHVEGKSC